MYGGVCSHIWLHYLFQVVCVCMHTRTGTQPYCPTIVRFPLRFLWLELTGELPRRSGPWSRVEHALVFTFFLPLSHGFPHPAAVGLMALVIVLTCEVQAEVVLQWEDIDYPD